MINKIYKSVLITGASSGIGLETLKRFFKEKIKIYALDKDISALDKLKKNINLKSFKLIFLILIKFMKNLLNLTLIL